MSDIYEGNISGMQNGAITLLDILGWKGIWQRKPDAIQALVRLIEKSTTKVENLVGNREIYRGLVPSVRSISDTIALVTHGDCDLALEFHAGICGTLITDSILEGIPVRGATCYGPLSLNGNIMVGPAVDEVAAWYEAAEWIGVLQTPSALLRGTHEYKYKQNIIEYEVPIKQYGKLKTYCSNWPYRWNRRGFDEGKLKDSMLAMGPITPQIAGKFFNTIEFYRKSKGHTN